MALQPVVRLIALLVAVATLMLISALPAQAVNIERVITPGGIEAWLVHDDFVPVISVSIAWRGGAVSDPRDRLGRARFTAAMLDEGAGDLDSQAFQRRLEDLAISLSFNSGEDEFRGELKTLRKNRDEAFRLLQLAITEPRFDDEPMERIRAQLIASLARDQEQPRSVAAKRWREIVYAGHPYASPVTGTQETVQAMSREDLQAFVGERLASDNLLVTVAGAITAEELAPLLDRTFGALPSESIPIQISDADVPQVGEVVVIRRNNPQSAVIFGQQAVKRDDPDFYAAYLMAYILGGGGSSARLNEEIRQKRGLAYSVGTHLSAAEYAAVLAGSVGTENGRTGQSIDLVRAEWKRMADYGVTAKELEDAKSAVIGGYVLRLTSTEGIAETLLGIRLENLGIDYLERRRDLIEKVTVEDIARVARELLDPAKLIVVIVGDPHDLTGAVREES